MVDEGSLYISKLIPLYISQLSVSHWHFSRCLSFFDVLVVVMCVSSAFTDCYKVNVVFTVYS